MIARALIILRTTLVELNIIKEHVVCESPKR
jgi:hypothetical protein